MRFYFTFAAICVAIGVLPTNFSVAQQPPTSLTVVVPDGTIASLLPPMPEGSTVCVLVRNGAEREDVIHSRAFKMRLATHFIHCSNCESHMTAIYRERLQNHGAIVIDLRTFPRSKLPVLLQAQVQSASKTSDGLSLSYLFPRR